MVVLSLIVIVLAALFNRTTSLWMQGQSQNKYRQQGRSALDLIGREMRLAMLSKTPGQLQFIINPSTLSKEYLNHDAVFWQAPIGNNPEISNIAEVGYFVRWIRDAKGDLRPSLCRFFADQSDPANFIYTLKKGWVSDELLSVLVPADSDHHYQGLFLENVIGLWVVAFDANGKPYSGDSRATVPPDQLPSYLKITLAVIDEGCRTKLQSVGLLEGLRNSVNTSATADELQVRLSNQRIISQGIRVITLTVDILNQAKS